MKYTKKIYVVGNNIEYAAFINNFTLVDDITKADIVIFTGGEDVDPSIYGCEKHSKTYSNINRDVYEKEVFLQISENQLVIGICRGSQFCCTMNGGLLVQDCNNHAIYGTHTIYEVATDKIYEITSTHHQMQYPWTINSEHFTVLFYAHPHLSDYFIGDKIDPMLASVEPEIVLYHKPGLPKCLAIQGHPEYMRKESIIIARLNEIIDELWCKM